MIKNRGALFFIVGIVVVLLIVVFLNVIKKPDVHYAPESSSFYPDTDADICLEIGTSNYYNDDVSYDLNVGKHDFFEYLCRPYLNFDVTSIPDDATIDEINLSLDVEMFELNGGSGFVHITKFNEAISSADPTNSPEYVYDLIESANEVLLSTNAYATNSPGVVVVQLPPSSLQDQLIDNYYFIGIRAETPNSLVGKFGSTESTSSISPRLTVSYSTPGPTQTPTPNPSATPCRDSDITTDYPDGINIFLKGTTYDENSSTPSIDYCSTNSLAVNEYFCNSTTKRLNKKEINCPVNNICNNGACGLKSYTLTTSSSPEQGGTITRIPDHNRYDHGSSVELTAEPNVGYEFEFWSGDLQGVGNPKDIVMDSDKDVSAAFVSVTPTPTPTSAPYIELTDCGILDQPDTPYILLNDVSSTGTCFTIAAEGVELDCDGYKITYSLSQGGYGIADNDFDYPVIINCNVFQGSQTSGSQAIRFLKVNTGTIRDSSVKTIGATSYGIIFSESSHNFIHNTAVETTGPLSNGIYLTKDSNSNEINLNNKKIITRGRDSSGIVFTAGLPTFSGSSRNIVKNAVIETYGAGNSLKSNGLLLMTGVGNEFRNIKIDSSSSGLIFDGSESEIEIFDSQITSDDYDIELHEDSGRGEINLTNTTFSTLIHDRNADYIINNHWYLSVKTKAANGNNLQTQVIAKDRFNNVHFSESTSSAGDLKKALLEYSKDYSTKTYYSVYSLTTQKSGYVSATKNVNISGNVLETISLNPTDNGGNNGGDDNGGGGGGGGGVCVSVWNCSGWSDCGSNGKQRRVCQDEQRCNPSQSFKVEEKNCQNPAAPKDSCSPKWDCTSWNKCKNEKQQRTCVDKTGCEEQIKTDERQCRGSVLFWIIMIIMFIFLMGVILLIIYMLNKRKNLLICPGPLSLKSVELEKLKKAKLAITHARKDGYEKPKIKTRMMQKHWPQKICDQVLHDDFLMADDTKKFIKKKK